MSQKRSEMVALNADVVGYSRLIADDLDAMTATMDRYRGLVERTVRANEGTLVNFVGDNFMAVFSGAEAAMRAAIAITTAIEAEDAAGTGGHRTRFRMGLDQGPVTISGNEYFGDALNISARIQALAEPGGISISGRVYRALDEPALRFQAVGRRQLKGIPEEVDLYQFADLPSDRSGASAHRSLSLESPTVAVFPIHAQTVDESVRSTAEMLRMDLLHRLAQIPQLKVVDARDDPSVGVPREPARYMIETGIHQAGEMVRVYATVMDVMSMNVVKSHKWNARADELFGLSDTLVDEVARALELDLIIGEPAGFYMELEDPKAVERIYLGWYHLTSGTPEGWARALDLFGAVAAAYPGKAYGHVLSAFANWVGASNGLVRDPEQTLIIARDQARVGLAAGDPTGLARMVEAAVLMSQGRGQDAIEIIENTEIQRPTCDVTFGLEGSVRRYLGEWQRAVDLTDKAMRLTGVNKPWYPTVQACSLFIGGRVEQAATLAEMVLEHQPRNLEALLVLAAAQVELGLERRARATADVIRERFPSVDVDAWLEANPYQGRDLVVRWRNDLIAAGAIAV